MLLYCLSAISIAKSSILSVTPNLTVVFLFLQVISIYGTGFTNVKDTKVTIGNAPPGSYKVRYTF